MAGLSTNERQIASAVKRGLHMMQGSGWSRPAARCRDVLDIAACFIGATTMISEGLAATADLNSRSVLTFCSAGFVRSEALPSTL